MKSLEEVRKICGHYIFREKFKNDKIRNPHFCRHKMCLCMGDFKHDCPLYALVKRSKQFTIPKLSEERGRLI